VPAPDRCPLSLVRKVFHKSQLKNHRERLVAELDVRHTQVGQLREYYMDQVEKVDDTKAREMLLELKTEHEKI
jgi:hypothetical protein